MARTRVQYGAHVLYNGSIPYGGLEVSVDLGLTTYPDRSRREDLRPYYQIERSSIGGGRHRLTISRR